MNSQRFDDSIPTLTEIVAPGDDSMKNHFDASCLDDMDDNEILETDSIDDAILNEEFKIDAAIETDAMDSHSIDIPVRVDEQKTGAAADISELHATIELLIDDALKETLPSIEQQLKQQLSETIIKKLSQQLDA
ncbi:MAG: hypothetical protein OQL06_05415 [Gammaproteobacteria bacterium]|nr:hypothetical protein [Gammaproteobacteria bacterium]